MVRYCGSWKVKIDARKKLRNNWSRVILRGKYGERSAKSSCRQRVAGGVEEQLWCCFTIHSFMEGATIIMVLLYFSTIHSFIELGNWRATRSSCSSRVATRQFARGATSRGTRRRRREGEAIGFEKTLWLFYCIVLYI